MRSSWRWSFVLVSGIAILSATCKSDSSGTDVDVDEELVLSIVGGNAQSAAVATAVTTAPSVKVVDQDGDAKSGVAVTFAVASGGGALTGATQTTNDAGLATVGGWTLGTTAGVNTITASVPDATPSSVTFTATGVAGAAASIVKNGGDAATVAAGSSTATAPSVRVIDAHGNPVNGVPVTFAVASGGGVISGAQQTTNAQGIATATSWTLGTAVGANSLTATATGTTIQNPTVTFTATGIAGALASLLKIAGDNQTATVGTLLGIPPRVRAADQYGNPIANQAVTFAVASGGGSATGTGQTTNAAGDATVGGWTLGAGAGANTMTATASTFTVTFNATALAAGFNAAQYAGTYTGTWINNTFASTGTGTATVAVNQANSTATLTVNVTGNVLNSGPVTNSVTNGAFTNNGVTFTGNVPPMGAVTATLGTNGNITASGVVNNGNVTTWSANGTLTSTSLNLTFTVNFAFGAPATGSITMTKP
jgi:adhesin/invasin